MTQRNDHSVGPGSEPTGAISHAAPACDLDAFVERVGGDSELAREMALLFAPDALRLLDGLKRAIEAGDAERVRQDAHALKGSASNFDADPTVAGALSLEMMGKAGDLTGATAVFDRLRVDTAALIDVLRAFSDTPP